jgi:hypothetical protein
MMALISLFTRFTRVAPHQQSWKEQRTPEYHILQVIPEWAMLGSNQRPLPCEGRSITSWLFTDVQKYLQNRPFVSGRIHDCSPSFVWVGVLLV